MSQAIYVVRSEPGPVKIGISGSPGARLMELRAASAAPLFMSFAAAVDRDVRGLEKRAHSILAERRLGGEWFDVDEQSAIAAVQQAAEELGLEIRPIDPGEGGLTSVRFTPETKAALGRAALKEGRSISNLMDRIATEWVRTNGYLPTEPEPPKTKRGRK